MSSISDTTRKFGAFDEATRNGRPWTIFDRVCRAAAVRYAQYRAARSLHALSDRQLRDIGITRGQINDVVGALRSSAASRR